MQERLAFTANFWGNAAVVCRAVEGRPGPIIDQEFGQFETWTQAYAFATRLNEGLELDPTEAQQIVTSSVLHTMELLNVVGFPECPCYQPLDPVAGKAVRVQFIVAQLDLAVTFCRIVRSRRNQHTQRMLRNARNALFNAMDYVFRSKLAACDLDAITAGLERLQEALQESLPQREGSAVTAGESWANSL